MKFFQIETTNIDDNYRAIPWIATLVSGQKLNANLFIYFRPQCEYKNFLPYKVWAKVSFGVPSSNSIWTWIASKWGLQGGCKRGDATASMGDATASMKDAAPDAAPPPHWTPRCTPQRPPTVEQMTRGGFGLSRSALKHFDRRTTFLSTLASDVLKGLWEELGSQTEA